MPELVPAAAPNAAGHTGDSDLRPRCLFSAGPALTTGPKTLIQAARPMVPCTRFRQRWTRSRVDAGPHVTGPASRPGCEQPFYRNVTAWHPATQPRNCALSRRARRVGWPLWQDWALIGGFGVRRAGHHHLGVVSAAEWGCQGRGRAIMSRQWSTDVISIRLFIEHPFYRARRTTSSTWHSLDHVDQLGQLSQVWVPGKKRAQPDGMRSALNRCGSCGQAIYC